MLGIESYFDRILELWMPDFISVLQSPTNDTNMLVKCQILKTLVRMFKGFPQETNVYAVQIMELVWKDLVATQHGYFQHYVYPSVDAFCIEDNYDDDGETHSLESFVYAALECFQLAFRKKQVKPLLQSNIYGIIKVLVGYMQLSTDVEISWGNDTNQLVLDEEENSMSHTVRVTSQHTLAIVLETFKDLAVVQLFNNCIEMFAAATESRQSGAQYWWKLSEAGLLALGTFPNEIVSVVRNQSLNMDYIFTSVLPEGIRCNSSDF